MAFNPATLIAQAKTDLLAIPGIGNVYDYRRSVKDETTAQTIWYHAGQGRFNAWNITVGDVPIRAARTTGFGQRGSGVVGEVLADVALMFEGVFGIDDANASERTFRDLCFLVFTSFNSIGLLTADVVHQEAFQWDRFGYLVLAGMFPVHYAKFSCRYTGRVLP